ncbi:MAG TPA: GNAT family N-acetyltransferase [Pyrinomonadaceae bacterium]|nr:GNAT family N-acetyltransferase [Pyrinomonadaceae bacterium]
MSYQIAESFRKAAPLPGQIALAVAPNMAQIRELKEENTGEVLAFLAARPVHTVVMTSFINDNGLDSSLNRGRFYGFRDAAGNLEGVALIGHTTLFDARTEESIRAFALVARESETPIHIIMSDGGDAESFWQYYTGGAREPRLVCTELLFEITFPVMVRETDEGLRPAAEDELHEIAEAHAEIAEMESGVNPLKKDREGFLQRTLRRIRQERVFVVFENGKLLFKADIVAETPEVIYLEGIYVAPDRRGSGAGPKYLAQLSRQLLNRVRHVCLLSNADFREAHSAYLKAGFKSKDRCTTIFV